MNILFVIVATIAVVLLITGGFVQSLNLLLWVGVVLLILTVTAFLLRMISGRRNVSPPPVQRAAGSGRSHPVASVMNVRVRGEIVRRTPGSPAIYF